MTRLLSRSTRLTTSLAVAMLLVSTLLPAAITAQEATPETTPGVLESEADETLCATELEETPTTEVGEDVATTFAIVSEESAVRYRAQEELATIGATEAVGETNAFIGQLLFDEAGQPLACSRFDADLRTLTSDSARRDNYLYENTLETGEFPLATFIFSSVEGLDAPLVDGEETMLILLGNLTIHGVTREVAWEATVTQEDDTITGDAWTTFEMPDFDITPPIVGQVVSIDETIRLEVDLTAERAS